MWKFFVANKAGTPVEINTDTGEDTGLVVATRPHKTFTSLTECFKNETYGEEMAQNGGYGTVDWIIHDGTDTTEADSGNCDGIGADTNKLKDSLKTFTTTVVDGMTVYNTTDGTYTWVTAVASDTELSLLDDIMDDGDDYIISPDWIFSEPVGTKWIENATDQFHNGTKSLKCDNPNVNDILQLLNVNGGDVTLAHCVAVSMWIRVEKDWKGGDSFSVYGHNAGAMIGNKVYLESYFSYDDYGIWHFINIPLIDMGLTVETLDAFRVENEAREGGKSPKFWVDEFEFRATGAAIDFTIEPDKGTWFHITTFQTTMVDALDTASINASMPTLSYDKLLGMEPTTGYLYKRYSGDEDTPITEQRITSLLDLLSSPNTLISNHICDGTNTLITVTIGHSQPLVLKSEDLDKLVISIEDDFSQLLFFRMCVQGYVEQRE